MKELKDYKYLFILIGGLVLFLIGSFFGLLMAYLFIGKGMSFDSFYQIIGYFANYYTDTVTESGEIISTIVQNYFAQNPEHFEIGKYGNILIQFFAYVPLLVLCGFLYKDFIKDAKEFKNNLKDNLIKIIIYFGLLLLCSYIITVVYNALQIGGQSDNESILGLMIDSDHKFLFIITVVFIGPFIEEVLYRKFIFDATEKTFKLKPIYAIIIAIFIFSLIHVSDLENIKYIFQYMAMAIPLTLAYHDSKNNIFVSTGVHILNNLIVALSYLAYLN